MQKKFMLLILAILILFASAILVGCGRDDMNATENSFNIFELIEKGSFDDITLSIYYMRFWLLTQAPVTLEQLIGGWYDNTGQLIGGWYDYRTVVTSQDLTEHRDLIKQLFTTELTPTKTESTIDARLYYVFEHKEHGEIFSFIAFAGGNVIVNGIEVKDNDIFYQVILPFLPEEIAGHIVGEQ